MRTAEKTILKFDFSGAPNEEKMGKGLPCGFLLSRIVLWSFKVIFVRANTV